MPSIADLAPHALPVAARVAAEYVALLVAVLLLPRRWFSGLSRTRLALILLAVALVELADDAAPGFPTGRLVPILGAVAAACFYAALDGALRRFTQTERNGRAD